jgi:hypothetical protein
MEQCAGKKQYSVAEILEAVEQLNAIKEIIKNNKKEYTVSEILEAVEALHEQN